MKTTAAILATLLLTGCGSMMTERVAPVSFESAKPVAFTVTSKEGRKVSGVTPAVLNLDSAVGAYECENYLVTTPAKKQEVDTTLSGWFWLGAVVSITSAVVDGAMGGMCELPETVTL